MRDAHACHARVLERFLRDSKHAPLRHLFACGVIRIAGNLHLAGLHATLPDQRLDQLLLTIPRHPSDAEYFSRPNRERCTFDGRMTAIIVDGYIAHGEAYASCRVHRFARHPFGSDRVHDGGVARLGGAHHQACQRVAAGRRYGTRTDLPALAQHGHVVGIRHHFAKLVRDHQHSQLAARGQVTHQPKHFVGLLRRQHGGRLIENEETLLEIQLLEDLQLLLFPCGKARNRRVQRQAKRHALHERFERGAFCFPLNFPWQAPPRKQQVLLNRQPRSEREMLVHHADTQRLRVARRSDPHLAATG